MVKTVVTPRVILAGVADLKFIKLFLFIFSSESYLFSQKLNQDMITMKMAGV